MTTDTHLQNSRKSPTWTVHESADNARVSPGPYVGIVKNNSDPTRSGKLQVYIAELGGDENSDSSWKTVSYCTPFYGRTNKVDNKDYAGHSHSYGMWFVPPDIGVKVLCTFAQGNHEVGFWFACIPDFLENYNLPGMAGKLDGSNPAPQTNGPVDILTKADTEKIPNVPGQLAHEYQKSIWDAQHLTTDPDRGPGTSSSMREAPSNVFGISTPGQPLDPNDPQYYTEQRGNDSINEWGVRGRKGGHTFIMDYGDAKGNNQIYRLRSSKGHMILMNDTKDFIYVINSKGTAWVEINAAGDINVFNQGTLNISSNGGMNLETKGDLKLHGKTVNIVSDGAFNMQATEFNMLASGSLKMTAKSDVHVVAKKSLYLTAKNCLEIRADQHIDMDAACISQQPGSTKSGSDASGAETPKSMPSIEPWSGHNAPTNPQSQPPRGSQQGLPSSGSSGPYGATNNFGSSNVQDSYGPMANNIPPVIYAAGLANFFGQGHSSGGYSGGVSNGVPYQQTTQSVGNTSGLPFGGGISFDAARVSEGNSDPNYTTGELQNNPGNLTYNESDKFAVGFANGLAVYARPEDGITQLCLEFISYNTNTSIRAIDLIVSYLNATSVNDPNVLDMTRYMCNNNGLSSSNYVALSDALTLLGWATNVISYNQGRVLYSFDQVVNGCAASLGIDYATFVGRLNNSSLPWQNNNNNSGFVSPTNSSVNNNGASPLTQILGGLALGAAVGGIVNYLSQSNGGNGSQQSQSNVISVSDANAARRYLEEHPETASGTTFKLADGSSFTLGGGSVQFADDSSAATVNSGGGGTNTTTTKSADDPSSVPSTNTNAYTSESSNVAERNFLLSQTTSNSAPDTSYKAPQTSELATDNLIKTLGNSGSTNGNAKSILSIGPYQDILSIDNQTGDVTLASKQSSVDTTPNRDTVPLTDPSLPPLSSFDGAKPAPNIPLPTARPTDLNQAPIQSPLQGLDPALATDASTIPLDPGIAAAASNARYEASLNAPALTYSPRTNEVVPITGTAPGAGSGSTAPSGGSPTPGGSAASGGSANGC